MRTKKIKHQGWNGYTIRLDEWFGKDAKNRFNRNMRREYWKKIGQKKFEKTH